MHLKSGQKWFRHIDPALGWSAVREYVVIGRRRSRIRSVEAAVREGSEFILEHPVATAVACKLWWQFL